MKGWAFKTEFEIERLARENIFSAKKPFMPSVKVVQREPADGSAPFSESQLLGGRV